MFELDSQLNNPPLPTFWCLHELNVFAIKNSGNGFLKQTCRTNLLSALRHILRTWKHGADIERWKQTALETTNQNIYLKLHCGMRFVCPCSSMVSQTQHSAFIWFICLVLCSISWHDNLTFVLLILKQLIENTVSQCWFIKLCWKQLGFVNTKCIGDLQIILQTQLTLYKLDTSIICCSVMVSTSDVSRKHIGDMANLAARRHGWWEGTTELLKRPFFRVVAVSCGNGTG